MLDNSMQIIFHLALTPCAQQDHLGVLNYVKIRNEKIIP